MKTKCLNVFKKSANTPPMWVCLLFALAISTNCWGDVTAEWGDYVSPARTFPSGSPSGNYDVIDGIKITPSSTLTSGYVYVGGRDSYNNYQLNDVGEYVEITLSSGTISSVQFCVWTANENLLKIRFCKESEYSDDPSTLTGEAYYVMHDAAQAGSGLQTINAPANAKSACIYKDGSAHWQCYLYRLKITASDDCASPETATFAAGESGNPTGSTPDDIERCQGSTFTMPDAGSLTWTGYAFTGWKLNNSGDLITAGTSYTMPAGGASFTAQWVVEPNIAEWGDYGDPATDFPSSSSSSASLNGIELAYDVAYSSGGVGWYSAHTYYWTFDDDNYCNITLASSYSSQVISEVSACVWYTGYGTSPEMYIQFYSSSTCADGYEIGTPQLITGQTNTASTLSTHTPSAAGAKSARIYSLGEAFMCRLIVTRDDACSTVTASFAKAGSETGNVPGDIEVCKDGSLTIPDAGTLTLSRHAFSGWSDGSDVYEPGDTYTMGDEDVEFTAVWEELVTPAVTNLTITDKENSTVPLSWKIPGKVDLSTATTSVSGYFINGQSAAGSYSYNNSTEELAVTYTASQWAQPGVAFPFTLSNLESITFEYKGHRVFPEVVKADGTASYWDYDVIETAADWTKVTRTPVHTYSGSVSAAPLPAAKAITFCANPNENKTNEIFYLRNVFYHVKDQLDIDHVVVMRKVGSAATGIDDAAATQLYSGTLSHFTDSEEKTVGTTYYYTVFAVDEDDYVSAATTVSATITNDTPHTVTYAKGDEAVDGSVPTDANTYVEGNNVTLAAIGDLAWSGHIFMGWSDGSDTYKPDDSYTMPDDDVTFTAQWRDLETPLLIPTGTTHLDASNYHAIPGGTYNFNVDGTGASTCIDIAGNQHAEWLAKFTPGHYRITLTYGTTGYAVNVTLKVYDGDTEIKATPANIHSDGSGAHTYQVTWSLDLTDLNPDKTYKVRVIDTYNDATSNPKVGYLDFDIVVPTDITNTATTRLDHTNVSVSPGTTSFDIKNDGHPVTCLDIKGQNQADWYVYITPDLYDINLLYGTPEYSTKVTFSIIDPSNGSAVFAPAEMTHSGAASTPWYEEKTWNNVDLSGLTANKQYIVRVKDTHSSTGSKPKVQYIDFAKHEVIQIGAFETVLNASNTISTVTTATDIDIDGDGNNDACMNLKNTYAEWDVNIARGVYTMTLEYGVPSSSCKVKVELIDPLGVESPRELLYHALSNDIESGMKVRIAPRGCDFSDITENKVYKIKVSDAYGGSGCPLRVRGLSFAPFEDTQIPTATRLDASNVFTPNVFTYKNLDVDGDEYNDECLYLRKKDGVTPVEWKVQITPNKYKLTLAYGAASSGYDITLYLVDPEVGGDGTSIYTKHVSSGDARYQKETFTVDWTNLIAGKEYIIRAADTYDNADGCKLRLGYIDFGPYNTYTRSGLTVGNYGTICLPYAVAAEDIHGADIFDMQGWPAGSVAVVLNEVDNMEAGRPYVIQTKASTITFSYFPEGDPTDAGTHNGLIGSYTKEVIPANENNYMVYKNKLYYVDVLSYVGINKAYINRTLAEEAAEPVAPAPGKRQIRLFLDGEQVITDIDQINDQMTNTKYMENGILYILREGKVYNAQGQLVK